jgi:hypothetical protein
MRIRIERMDNVEQQRMLRETTPPDFLDSSLEWRRIFSETWGTVLLTMRTGPRRGRFEKVRAGSIPSLHFDSLI